MAFLPHSSLAFTFIFSTLLLSMSMHGHAGREIPKNPTNLATNVDDKKQPEFFTGGYDGTVLIPGFGRVVIPPKGSHVNPFTYNPITGRNDGNGLIVPGSGSFGSPAGGGGRGSYLPGGDDTFVPNPGFEVPNPGAGRGGSRTPIPGGN